MKTANIQSGEKVTVTDETRNLGHGEQVKVVYTDGTEGWEHVSDLQLNFDDSKSPINTLTPARQKEIELSVISQHFRNLYAEEITAGEVDGNVIHEWWNMTKDQYTDNITFKDVENAILS